MTSKSWAVLSEYIFGLVPRNETYCTMVGGGVGCNQHGRCIWCLPDNQANMRIDCTIFSDKHKLRAMYNLRTKITVSKHGR